MLERLQCSADLEQPGLAHFSWPIPHGRHKTAFVLSETGSVPERRKKTTPTPNPRYEPASSETASLLARNGPTAEERLLPGFNAHTTSSDQHLLAIGFRSI